MIEFTLANALQNNETSTYLAFHKDMKATYWLLLLPGGISQAGEVEEQPENKYYFEGEKNLFWVIIRSIFPYTNFELVLGGVVIFHRSIL